MPCISGIFDKSGLLIEVGILPHGEHLNGSLKLYRALIDTGASRTCVSDRLVEMYQFAPTGDATMNHAWGSNKAHTYLFNMFVPTRVDTGKDGSPSGDVSMFTLEGLSFKAKSDFDVLIGRDFLCRGSLSLSFDGHFTLCF
ncbi:MAG: hypothetical protein AAF621_04605 [Pseudomonadota bacterium]